jgi:hypothetical protein
LEEKRREDELNSEGEDYEMTLPAEEIKEY